MHPVVGHFVVHVDSQAGQVLLQVADGGRVVHFVDLYRGELLQGNAQHGREPAHLDVAACEGLHIRDPHSAVQRPGRVDDPCDRTAEEGEGDDDGVLAALDDVLDRIDEHHGEQEHEGRPELVAEIGLGVFDDRLDERRPLAGHLELRDACGHGDLAIGIFLHHEGLDSLRIGHSISSLS